jgi:hypothetical protein
VLFSDFGKDQPIGVPAALLALKDTSGQTSIPHIYVETGKESRADPAVSGDFGGFGLLDQQADTDTSSPAVVQSCLPTVQLPCQFAQTFITGFRGTTQPATTFADAKATTGRVFFVGTRFNPAGSAFAPPVPPRPCRSSFDSIFFALGAETGQAAYDLNASGEDAYVVLRNSKIQSISFVPDTTSTGQNKLGLVLDEGLRGGQPPSAGELHSGGLAPTGAAGGTGVSVPLLRQSSTVCQ